MSFTETWMSLIIICSTKTAKIISIANVNFIFISEMVHMQFCILEFMKYVTTTFIINLWILQEVLKLNTWLFSFFFSFKLFNSANSYLVPCRGTRIIISTYFVPCIAYSIYKWTLTSLFQISISHSLWGHQELFYFTLNSPLHIFLVYIKIDTSSVIYSAHIVLSFEPV